jgi:hypothetical protein
MSTILEKTLYSFHPDNRAHMFFEVKLLPNFEEQYLHYVVRIKYARLTLKKLSYGARFISNNPHVLVLILFKDGLENVCNIFTKT